MPYRRAETACVVRLVPLRPAALSATTRAQCEALRAEAGRLWTDLVRLHAQGRARGQWLTEGELEKATKGGQYALHSQSVQALCQKFAANVATATTLRQQELAETGQIQTEYPHHAKPYQTVVWKDQALEVLPHGQLLLPTGRRRPPLVLPLPEEYPQANLRRAELTWRADHYELCVTLDTGEALSPLPRPAWPKTAETLVPMQQGVPSPAPRAPSTSSDVVAGIDLGEVHIAAVTTTRRHALVVTGRMLRACKQGRNRQHAILQAKLHRCQPGSRRSKRLLKRKAQASAKLYRQQRDILHQAAKKVVDFCQQEGVTWIAVGDVRDIQTGVSLGRATNQKISQWPHGQFVRYLREKAARRGIALDWIDESSSTKTCSISGHVRTSSPRGRRFRCPGCGARVHRDVNGANNICSKAVYGVYAQVQADTVKYLRPIGVVPRHGPT
jgi:putative transposase